MQLQDVVTDLNTALQGVFGANTNLAPNSVFGNFVGIMSERFTLIWQLGEAIWDSQYPSGAEGTSVDNILALNNLKRDKATPTKTAPENVVGAGGIVQYPLVLGGVPGTSIPGGAIIQTGATPPLSFTLDAAVVIGAAVNAQQAVFFGNVPTQGAFALSIADPAGQTLTMAQSPWNVLAAQAQVFFDSVPTTGTFKLILTQAGAALTTAFINWNDNATAVQAAITALSGYSGVTVTGDFTAGFVINWGAIAHPVLTFSLNTLMNGTSPVVISTVDSVQATINNLLDAVTTKYPYTDVYVTGSFGSGFLFDFGAGTPVGSNPASSDQQQSLMAIVINTLQDGITVTNLNVTTVVMGSPAQAVGSASCTVDGPNFVGAGSMTVIGTAVSGWNTVNNQLDCISGSNVETDTEALVRRSLSLAQNANGPIQAIVEKVRAVPNVTTAIAFQNQTNAAQQTITFSSTPVSGTFKLTVGFLTTGTIPFNCTAAQIQTAIRALTGFSTALVTGTIQYGFTVDFNGSQGSQAQPLIIVSANGTGVSIVTAFGRPPKSFEIVALGGSDIDIATAIYGSMPAGTQSYGNTTFEIFDEFNNPVFISFSRPTEIPIFVVITLLTDYYNTPGNPGSGVNPKANFNPQTISTIQSDVVDTGSEVSIGGLVIGFGSNGLIGAFNSVVGLLSYTMFFGTAPSPTQNVNIQMLSEQIPLYELFNVVVSWT